MSKMKRKRLKINKLLQKSGRNESKMVTQQPGRDGMKERMHIRNPRRRNVCSSINEGRDTQDAKKVRLVGRGNSIAHWELSYGTFRRTMPLRSSIWLVPKSNKSGERGRIWRSLMRLHLLWSLFVVRWTVPPATDRGFQEVTAWLVLQITLRNRKS